MILTKRSKTCRVCGNQYLPFQSTQKVCGIACAAELGAAKTARDAARVERKEFAARRAALKTRSGWLAEAQVARNAVVRERDRADGCISCDKPATWQGQWHASHYLSVGSHPALRFDMANIHKSCSVCNYHLSGNRRGYEPRLIAKIGIAEVERLESSGDAPLKITIDELEQQIVADRALLRQMVAERELNEEAA